MTFTSPLFLLFVLVTAFLCQMVPARYRNVYLMSVTAVFVATYVSNWVSVMPLLLIVCGGYGALMLIESGRSKHTSLVSVVVLVGLFVWLKNYPFVTALPRLPFSYEVVGLSYILFRMLHLIFEISDGALARPHFSRYLSYLFFFPAFLSGPINRFEPFNNDIDAPAKLDSDAGYATLLRFLNGFAKVAVISECLIMIHNMAADRLDAGLASGAAMPMLAILYAGASGLYLLFLYANFSGYTDMAISIARLFGIVLPENFDQPFMAINFQDFWSRWHITLSEWFKVYCFNPLLKFMMQIWWSPKAAPYLGVVALFIVFVVLGAWHGASWEYLLCGVLLATGVSVNKLYQVEMVKRFGKKPYQQLTRHVLYLWAARGLTMAWVSVSLTPFWVPIGGISALLGRAGLLGLGAAILIMSVAFAVAILLISKLVSHSLRSKMIGEYSKRGAVRYSLLSLSIVALLFAVPLINASTDFVYKAF
jgi:alginate O-acetyltransferase complex protein AlgI